MKSPRILLKSKLWLLLIQQSSATRHLHLLPFFLMVNRMFIVYISDISLFIFICCVSNSKLQVFRCLYFKEYTLFVFVKIFGNNEIHIYIYI